MSLAIEGAIACAAILKILGPKPSIPVAFDVPSLPMR